MEHTSETSKGRGQSRREASVLRNLPLSRVVADLIHGPSPSWVDKNVQVIASKMDPRKNT